MRILELAKSHMFLNINDDAIFIADAHYNKNRTQFDTFLDDILCHNIKTSQLFLMGDMFDFLCFEIDYFKGINKNVISKINLISQEIEVIYIEGNHDFNLSNIFQNSRVITRQNQPIICEYKTKRVAIAHGDKFLPLSYELFTRILRNTYFLKILNFLDINNVISKYFEKKLDHKNICTEFDDFSEFSNKRIKFYEKHKVEKIIEGHFHQGKVHEKYVNVPSYACENRFYNIN